MELTRLETLEPTRWPSPAVAIGNFDGVHRGHQALIRAVVERVRETSGTSVVLSFDPHPARVVAPERAPTALLSLEQRGEILAGLGVDRLAILPFDAAVAALGPEDFARAVLGAALGARFVVVGSHFRFGRGRQGDVALLAELGASIGFQVRALPPVTSGGEPISSSRIREALARGDTGEAARLLGRDPFLDGVVVRGAGRGKSLGFPTANLAVVNETLPANGVYAALCRLEAGGAGVWRPAVVNVGTRPTFDGVGVTVEAHVMDFAGDLYGQTLRVGLRDRLRGEQRFAGPEALLTQIRKDVERAREILEKA